MNITQQQNTLPLSTVINLPTDSLRRDNNLREVIAQPAAASQSAAEKGVASEKDKAKNPGQNNESIDFATIRKQAEGQVESIGDSTDQQGHSSGNQNTAEDSEAKSHSETNQEKSPQEEFIDEQLIIKLQQRDSEVRAHESAHASVGGISTGAPTFSFEVGPDGKKYAVSGEVSVDLHRIEGEPRSTIAKMQKVYAAALAPISPSAQDNRVAATALNIIDESQEELLALKIAEDKSIDEAKEQAFNEILSEDEKKDRDIQTDFDILVNRTLHDQEQISPQRSEAVTKRAVRVESFYFEINHAYEPPPKHHF